MKCIVPVCSDNFANSIFKCHVNQSIGFKSFDCKRASKAMFTCKDVVEITAQVKRRFLPCS